MQKFVSIRTKFIKLSTKILLGTAGALCCVGVLLSTAIINKIANESKLRIINATIQKGDFLIVNNCLALSTMAQDNAFSNIKEIITTALRMNHDIIYGIYMDRDRRMWVDARLENLQGEVRNKITLEDTVSLWADGLTAPGHLILNGGQLIEFAGPVTSADGAKLGTVRYGLTMAALKESIAETQRKVYFSVLKSCLVILLIGIAIFVVSSREARRQANAITLPIQKLTDAAHTITAGNYAVPMALTSNDEIGVLAGDFEKMRQTIKQYTDNLEAMVAQRTRELNDAMVELTRSNTELEQFAYVTSHDLREPLRMISSYTNLLQKKYGEKLDSDAKAFIAFAVDGAGRMQDLIEDLLTYSRVGTKAKPFEPLDCTAIFEIVTKNLEVAITEKKATVTAAGLPRLMADRNQLIQLLQNLIANALKFCKDRPPQIHVAARDNESEWEFCVRDNGIGIAPQHWDTIFQIFQRLHTREEYEGTGIGLAVVKKIVERHGGRIWLESQLGLGTTFFFTIPKRPLEG
jgi:signal transduction histidine kinase